MNKTQNEKNEDASQSPRARKFRHPYPAEHSKEEMFRRMETVDERIAAFKEKLNADRKKNSR